jgi:hypothetical protein
VAHKELPSELANSPAIPLSAGSRADVEAALRSLRAVMNAIESHYQKRQTSYENTIGSMSGASALLHYLRMGKEAQDEIERARGYRRKPDG